MAYAALTEHDATDASPLQRTQRLRDEAQRLIQMLRHAKAQTEAKLTAESREDAYASVRGASSFDQAIAHAEHTRDVLDRALQNADA